MNGTSHLDIHRRTCESVARTVLFDLEHQHDWTGLEIIPGSELARFLIRGLPPKRLYLHPDDQVAALALERRAGESLCHEPQYEWVLPVHLAEKWSLAGFSTVFDLIDMDVHSQAKRVLLAILHNDSTVVYYFMHQGIVKPRQN
ncbi:hypothetical protein L249_7909 [Ophiocordyceps polyrhachis-furcata BCC 54312]|uniref:tRNA-splicing endonuclease subunit Sen15 domain-containing protein n=1 Tax=Ophiocordyceps polyrhachis-furcata BCC 54312 TaxID=1330021 RepID=A0A367LHF5_9HYPO|nr:hypothetical protein L249_7909 [Ophiocordyceps polyrhachis-furcata BCC 54312]